MKKYKVVNGISFSEKTPDAVCCILSSCYDRRTTRVRIFLGDSETGKDWFETWGTIGYIGRSTGSIKIPLLIANSRSIGGPAILDDCIVKITIDKKVVYKHPNYHAPLEIRGNELWDAEKNSCIYKNEKGVDREYNFYLGLRNSH